MRFAALITVLAVAEKLKENYIVLLPESIPFLAELMEGKPNANKQRCKTLWPLADTDLSESFTCAWGTSQEAVTSQSLRAACSVYCIVHAITSNVPMIHCAITDIISCPLE